MPNPFEQIPAMPQKNKEQVVNEAEENKEADEIQPENLSEEEMEKVEKIESQEIKEIMERAKEMRADLLMDIFKKASEKIFTMKTLDKAMNLPPGIDFLKMFAEAYKGETLVSKEKLSKRERVVSAAIAGSSALSWTLCAANMPAEALIARSASTGLFYANLIGPALIKKGMEFAKNNPKTSILLEKTLDYISDKREQIAQIRNYINGVLAPKPEYESRTY